MEGTLQKFSQLADIHTRISVHSLRKGAGTFALNGIVGVSASVSAVCLRAGWTQGAIKDKYLKYEGAADTYLGRILAGYPLTGPNAVKFGGKT